MYNMMDDDGAKEVRTRWVILKDINEMEMQNRGNTMIISNWTDGYDGQAYPIFNNG